MEIVFLFALILGSFVLMVANSDMKERHKHLGTALVFTATGTIALAIVVFWLIAGVLADHSASFPLLPLIIFGIIAVALGSRGQSVYNKKYGTPDSK